MSAPSSSAPSPRSCQVFFSRHTQKITGCSIEPYLLEKSRVTSQQPGERNYHVFYRMMDGLDPAQKSALKLKGWGDHVYLNGGTGALGTEYERVYANETKYHDQKAMKDTQEAFSQFFSDEVYQNCLRITAGVLALGDIQIIAKGSDHSEVVDNDSVDAVAELWKVNKAALIQACHMYSRNVVGKLTPSVLGVPAAMKYRDSMARSVFNQLFEWLVKQCSDGLKGEIHQAPGGDVYMGILDIFGFEFVPSRDLAPSKGKLNSFEQYCINLCNEQLQATFIDVVFGVEQQLYKEQLGHAIDLKFDTNTDTLELLQARKGSIISMLDEVTANPPRGEGKADEKFFNAVSDIMRNHVANLEVNCDACGR